MSDSTDRKAPVLVVATVLTAVSLYFAIKYALIYLEFDHRVYRRFWTMRHSVFFHMIFGTIVLLLGPIQILLSGKFNRSVHRTAGKIYVFSIVVSSIPAFWLARHTVFSWTVAVILMCTNIIWVVSALMGALQIARGQLWEHKKWMIRSYLITWTFVVFRYVQSIGEFQSVGTLSDRITLSIAVYLVSSLFIAEICFSLWPAKAPETNR